jgi:hypothetical protein
MTTGRSVGREIALVAAVGVVVALIVAVGLAVALKATLSSIDDADGSRDQPVAAGTPSSGGVPGAAVPDTRSQPSKPAIALRSASATARRNSIVRLSGRYNSHPSDKQTLRVQVRQQHTWITFPLPAVCDDSGRFKAYVELGHRGVNRLRVIDRSTGVVSNVATVTVR